MRRGVCTVDSDNLHEEPCHYGVAHPSDSRLERYMHSQACPFPVAHTVHFGASKSHTHAKVTSAWPALNCSTAQETCTAWIDERS